MSAVIQSRRERRHRETRDEILDAACEVMIEVGAESLSLREVARRAGFSPASLYTYFASRDEILVALTEASLGRLAAALDKVPRSLPPDRRIVEYGMAYLAFAERNPADLQAIVTCTAMGLPDKLDRSVGLATAHLIAATFREGLASGVFEDAPGRDVASLVFGAWALVHGMTVLRHIDLAPVSGDISAQPRQALEVYVAGLKRRSPDNGGRGGGVRAVPARS